MSEEKKNKVSKMSKDIKKKEKKEKNPSDSNEKKHEPGAGRPKTTVPRNPPVYSEETIQKIINDDYFAMRFNEFSEIPILYSQFIQRIIREDKEKKIYTQDIIDDELWKILKKKVDETFEENQKKLLQFLFAIFKRTMINLKINQKCTNLWLDLILCFVSNYFGKDKESIITDSFNMYEKKVYYTEAKNSDNPEEFKDFLDKNNSQKFVEILWKWSKNFKF